MDPAKLRPGASKLITLPQNLIINPGTQVEDFESAASWTAVSSPAGGTLEDDGVDKKVGSNSLKITTPAAEGYMQVTKTVNFRSNGNMRFWIYIPGAAPSNITMLFGNEPSAWTNYFSAGLNVGGFRLRNVPGWNLISLRGGTTDWWVGGGVPSWNNPIRQVRIKINTAGDATVINLDNLVVGQKVQPAMVLTFDDGIDSEYLDSFVFLRKHRVRGSLYIVSDWMDSAGCCTWAQLREMVAAGWTVGNHSKTHTNFTTLSEAEQETEINDCEAALAANGCGVESKHLAFPFGASDANTLLAMAATGMLSGRHILHYNINSQVGQWNWLPASFEPDPSTSLAAGTAWVDGLVSRQELGIGVFHGTSGAPEGSDWYSDRFQALIIYCIAKGIPIISVNDLYRLQSGPIVIPRAI